MFGKVSKIIHALFFKLLLYKLKVISKKLEYLISRNVDNWFQLNLIIGQLKHVYI